MIELEQNLAAVSIETIRFQDNTSEWMVVVGCVRDMVLGARQPPVQGELRTYKIDQSGRRLEFMHSVSVEII